MCQIRLHIDLHRVYNVFVADFGLDFLDTFQFINTFNLKAVHVKDYIRF